MADKCIDKKRSQLNVRANEDLIKKAQAKAGAEGKSLSQKIVMYLEQYVSKPNK
jgi:hypothetical protein